MYYYRARWYDANLGRFISEDPIGFSGGDINLYGYVGNNPIFYTDPLGFERYGGTFYKEAAERWGDFHKKRVEFDYQESYRPENFRCGPHTDSILSLIIPQHPLGYNFKDAGCYQHDVCYGTCGETQKGCDDEFLSNLERECNSKGTWFERQMCLGAARQFYYRMVAGLGGSAYKDAQKYNNCCNK